eukprot:jgi/Botrbrau1/18468/Bobra.0072s0050.1
MSPPLVAHALHLRFLPNACAPCQCAASFSTSTSHPPSSPPPCGAEKLKSAVNSPLWGGRKQNHLLNLCTPTIFTPFLAFSGNVHDLVL